MHLNKQPYNNNSFNGMKLHISAINSLNMLQNWSCWFLYQEFCQLAYLITINLLYQLIKPLGVWPPFFPRAKVYFQPHKPFLFSLCLLSSWLSCMFCMTNITEKGCWVHMVVKRTLFVRCIVLYYIKLLLLGTNTNCTAAI